MLLNDVVFIIFDVCFYVLLFKEKKLFNWSFRSLKYSILLIHSYGNRFFFGADGLAASALFFSSSLFLKNEAFCSELVEDSTA